MVIERSACTREAKCSHRVAIPRVITQPREGSFYRPPVYSTPSLPPTYFLSVPRILRQPLFHAARLPHFDHLPVQHVRAEEQTGRSTGCPLKFYNAFIHTVLDRSNDIASRIFLFFFFLPSVVTMRKKKKRTQASDGSENSIVRDSKGGKALSE